MATPAPGQAGPADDPLPEATALARDAAEEGLGLKLLGGLAVRVLCPGFPPRLRAGQDMDFACLSKGRKKVAAFLERSGCEPDRRFNNLNGDRQMYFTAPSGRPVDVMVDRLTMCHTLDLRPSFGKLPLTIDAVDVLLSKLQIVELNSKDARDILHLLGGVPVQAAGAGAGGPSIDSDRFAKLLAADWGWWRTVTGNLAKLPALAAEHPELLPPDPPLDPIAQSRHLLDLAESTPKSVNASTATSASTRSKPWTAAKSRTRRSSRFAMRGVPRLRPAMVTAPSWLSVTPSSVAERSTITVSSSGS